MSELDGMIETLRELQTLVPDSMPAVTGALRSELERTIGAGTTPDGVPWAPRKQDGRRAMVDAVSALAVTHSATTIYAQVRGPEARHHLGWGRGGVQRQVLPTDGLTAPQANAMRAALARMFDRRVQP